MNTISLCAVEDVARRVIEETVILHLSLEDQQRFAEFLLDPPSPNPALQRAAQAHVELIRNADVPRFRTQLFAFEHDPTDFQSQAESDREAETKESNP